MAKRFNSILKRYGLITEEDSTAALGSVQSAIPQASPDAGGAPNQKPATAPGTIENQEPAPEKKELSSENYVLLVKLLKSAFLASPDEEDSALVNNLKFTDADGNETNEINENNADEAFNKLLPIISKYTTKDKSVSELLTKVSS